MSGAVTLDTLTPKQRMIAWRLARGMTNDEIAVDVHLSAQTVKNYLMGIRTALDMENATRMEVALWVLDQQGRLGPEPDEFAP